MDLVQSFKDWVTQNNLFSKKDRLLLAVSGGIDSVVLCELCRQAGFDFTLAHCNFQLREEESERDERFVQSLGKKYGTQVLVKKFNTTAFAAQQKTSVQVAARELRYDWFRQLINTEKIADYLLTAHHADDNAETIVMNFFRGTGLHGLTGMPAIAEHIRRPLLAFSKEQLKMFAKEHNLEFVEDSSNASSKYTRNLFRNDILPLIEKVYPEVKDNLQDNIKRFKEIEALYQLSTAELKKKLCKKKGNEIHIAVRQLLSYNNRALIYEIIAGYGFNEKQVDEVLKLAESDSGKYIQSPSGTFRIIRNRHWFIISPARSIDAENIVIEENDKRIKFADGQLEFKTAATFKDLPSASTVAALDAAEISFPLLLRRWKQGDYFYPLGMKKKKKLSRFFIDQKFSKTDKERIWVLEMNKKIIWVVGKRIDDRYKVVPATKKVLEISVL